jgi:hypothetical protein
MSERLPELAEILSAIRATAGGEGGITREELVATIWSVVGRAAAVSSEPAAPYIHALTDRGYLSTDSQNPAAFRLTRKAESFTLDSRWDEALKEARAAEDQLFQKLRDESPEAIPEQDLYSVTRRFLEDILGEAQIPPELLDAIVFAYQIDGRVTMSEDGRRYIIRL